MLKLSVKSVVYNLVSEFRSMGKFISVLSTVSGSGWKAYTAGIGMMLYGVVIALDASGFDVMPNLVGTYDQALSMFLLGLAAFGIRDKLQKGVSLP